MKDVSTMQVVADTFPAGTLSGAPKHRAMQLIEKYEKTSRYILWEERLDLWILKVIIITPS